MNQLAHQPVKFLLCDDHQIVRQGLQFIVEDIVEDAEIRHASSLHQILEQAAAGPADIAILDAQFPDGNSLSVVAEIKRLQPHIRILIFTSSEESHYALKFIKEGADGFLSKLSEEDEIRNALSQIIETGNYLSPLTQKLLASSASNPGIVNPLHLLTGRELEIAELYTKGYGNLEIANQLSLRQNTVSTFKKRIFEKLGVLTLVELIEVMSIHGSN